MSLDNQKKNGLQIIADILVSADLKITNIVYA